MSRLNCCLETLCLVGSLVCLSAGSYCFADCPNIFGGQCLLSHEMKKLVAGSYSDGTPVCTRWSDYTCLNLYVLSGTDNNGMDAVAFTPSITIIASHEVGSTAEGACGGSACHGCPPAVPGLDDNPSITGGTVTSYKKCCTTVGGSCMPVP